MRDLYTVLGISKAASPDEIKAAYKKLISEYHPDINPDINANEMSKMFNEAYEILSDKDKKQAYDRSIGNRTAQFNNPPPPSTKPEPPRTEPPKSRPENPEPRALQPDSPRPPVPVKQSDFYPKLIQALIFCALIFSWLDIYPLLDEWRPALCGAGFLILVCVLILRSRISDFWKEMHSKDLPAGEYVFIPVLGFMLMVFSLILGNACVQLGNCVADGSVPAVHRVKVLEKLRARTASFSKYKVAVESWRPGESREEVRVSPDDFARIASGSSTLEVNSKRGTLGFEWIESAHLVQ